MFKQNDPVVVVRLEATVRPTTIHEQAKDPGLGSFITGKPKSVEKKAVIGSLHNLYVGVRLPSGEIKHCLYVDLTFLKNGKVSFKSKKPDWKGVVKNAKGVYVETVKPGKPITVRGQAVLRGLHIPVLIDGKPYQVLYENLKFKETK